IQRRAGVATLVAATAAGKKRNHLVVEADAPALELIEELTPRRARHPPAPGRGASPPVRRCR
ncbi:hypothetical protein, partial [Nocardia wallacei]|uniref:hypothetical protein n=1 Tax=Nocardia wallacei TaxID=480035 RepID=UPI002457121A